MEFILFTKLKNFDSFLNKYRRRSSFIICFFILVAYYLVHDIRIFFHDSYGYWQLSTYFLNNGNLIDLKVPSIGSIDRELFSIRGYVWPYIISIIRKLSNDTFIGYWLGIATIYSLGISVLLGDIFESLFKISISWKRRSLVMIAIIYFWPGLLLYPLTDMPMVIFLTTAIFLTLKVSGIRSVKYNILCMLSIGFFLGIAYYTRPVTVPSIFIIIYIITHKKNWKYILASVLCISIGLTIIAIPQYIININFNNNATYKVPIAFMEPYGKVAMDNMFFEGATNSRYETVVSKDIKKDVEVARDNTAYNILKVEKYQPEKADIKTFLNILIKYPVEFLGIYTADFANAMDSRYGEIYIQSLYSKRYLKIISNFILWFIFSIGIFYQLRNSNKEQVNYNSQSIEIFNFKYFSYNYGLYILAFIIPSISQFAAHVEPRYFILLHILVFCYVFWLCPIKEIYSYIKLYPISNGVLFIVLFGVCSSIWNLTLSNFPDSDKLFINSKNDFKKYNVEEVLPIDNLKINGEDKLVAKQIPVKLENNTFYRIKFEIDSLVKNDVKLFYFDFYGENYDFPEQDLVIEPESIKAGKFEGIIFSGNFEGDIATYLRCVVLSEKSFNVENISLEKLSK